MDGNIRPCIPARQARDYAMLSRIRIENKMLDDLNRLKTFRAILAEGSLSTAAGNVLRRDAASIASKVRDHIVGDCRKLDI
jgi:hypothetical protein